VLILLGLLYYKGRVPRLFVAIGDGTYSIYLLHGTLIAVLSKVALVIGLPAAIGGGLAYASVLSGALIAAWVFYRLVERPVIAVGKARLDGVFRGPKASSTAARTTTPER
jgi:peptidoglycan/LPS O-acetylase OafA/YrhL